MTHLRTLSALVIAILSGGLALGQDVRLKIASIAPEGTPWMEEAHKAADEIEHRTNGRVTFRFYPGGVMGSDSTVLRKMRIGQLQGGAVLPGALAEIVPDVELYAFPMLFRSYDEVDYVRKRMDPTILDLLSNHGLESFGLIETGFVYIMSDKAIRSLEDLGDRKIWIPEGDVIAEAIVDAAGVSPVSLSISDVMTGLQTGLVDTVVNSPVGAVVLQWFTRAKYVTDLPITYSFGTMVLSERAWSKISPEDQAVVREILGAWASKLDKNSRVEDQDAREALVKQGVTFVAPAEGTADRWQQIADDATRKLSDEGRYDADLIKKIEGLLEAFRAAHPGG
jgi:TRAP-type C4-dicarboxylate transport system substrate-binding protein